MVRNVLKVAWARFGHVKKKDVEDNTMAFEFETDRVREQILDLSPWSVKGHYLNLRIKNASMSMDEVQVDILEIWIQVHGLSLDVYNEANARHIGSSVGRFLAAEPNHVAKSRDYLRIRVEINVVVPLPVGFTWTNDKGQGKWATFKFERLSDLCYDCGCLGHTSQACDKEIAMDHQNEGRLLYGPCLQGTRPTTHRWHKIGGGQKQELPTRDRSRQSWRDIMDTSREGVRWDSSMGTPNTSSDSTARTMPS